MTVIRELGWGRRYWLSALVVCVLAVTICLAGNADPIGPLIANFVAEQEKSLSQLRRFEVTLELYIWFESGDLTVEHVGEINQKHAPDRLRVDVTRQTTERDRNGNTRSAMDTSARFVVGDGYALYWMRNSKIAQIWEYGEVSDLPHPARLIRRIDMEGDYIHCFGFGTMDFEFKQLLDPDFTESFRYEVEQVSGGKYEIRLYLRDGVGSEVSHPVQTAIVDPAQGCLVVHSLMLDPDGRPYRQIDVQGEEIAPGVWFPIRARLQMFSDDEGDQGGGARLVTLREYKARSVRIVDSFEPDTFTWKSLAFPAGMTLYRTDVLGEQRALVVENGELVPKDLALEKREQ